LREPPVHNSTDDVHAHPRHTGHRGIDLILALTAVFISALSLYVAVEHGRTERDLVAANSWPYLQFSGEFHNSGGFQLSVENAGIGPAKLQTLELLLDGHPVSTTGELLKRCCAAEIPDPSRIHLPFYGLQKTVMRAGEKHPVLTAASADLPAPLLARFTAAARGIHLRACYCSVFDECWVSDLETLHPRKIETCPADMVPFNE
jgi:hypothetical protein